MHAGPEPDPARLGRTALKVPLVDDPDPRPNEGHFTLDLRADSDVLLRIWHRTKTRNGSLVHQRSVPNLPKEESPVPWDLRGNDKSVVNPGDFLAVMMAKPRNGNLDQSGFFDLQGNLRGTVIASRVTMAPPRAPVH